MAVDHPMTGSGYEAAPIKPTNDRNISRWIGTRELQNRRIDDPSEPMLAAADVEKYLTKHTRSSAESA
jgi:hypothetical protein